MKLEKSFFIALVVIVLAVGIFETVWNLAFQSVYYDGLKNIGYLEEGSIAPNLPYMFLSEVIFIVVTMYLVLKLAKNRSLQSGVLYGALLGFLCFGMANIVNLAFIKDYSLFMTTVDTVRTLLLGALVGGLTIWFAKKNNR